MKARLHLLPWDRPLLGQAVAWLAADWVGDGPLDLAHLLVVVPTRQSGRRLREALAAHAWSRGQAVFSPRVVLPETLTTLGVSSAGVASRLVSQLAWIRVLREIPLEEFQAVFPIEPPARDFAWARRLASQLLHLQSTLIEVGLQISEVGAKAGADFPEAERWQQLAHLEQRYQAVLGAQHLQDAQAAKLDFARRPVLPPEVKKIIVLGTPDPWPLACQILGAYAKSIPVEIGVFGPAEEPLALLFDDWGRPRLDFWTQRELRWAQFNQQVRLCVDPATQAGQLVALAQRYEIAGGGLALGIADAEILAPLAHGLSCVGVPAFNPEGLPRRQDGLYALLSLLAEFARRDAFSTSTALLRCPAILDWLAAQSGPDFSRARLLRELDALQAEHLPPTLAAARNHVKKSSLAAEALARLAALSPELQQGAFPQNCLQLLAKLFADHPVKSVDPLVASAAAWVELAEEVGRALQIFPDLTPGEGWEFALAQFAESVAFADKPAGAIELNGWLELLWEDAPHLVVAGLNDGRVPEVVSGDAFLPEVLRERLGLKTNGRRFARDVYLLAALAATRTTAGRLEILLGKVSLAGDPLRPSRLLLRCADEDLPRRIKFLFEKVISEAQRLCGEWPRGKPGRVHTPFTPTPNEFTQIMPNTNRAYIGMMMPAPALGDMRRYASSLISQIVGDREGSKFYWSVVETGLAEEASCSFEGRDGLGEYLVFAACESQNVAEVEKRLHAEMGQLSQTLQQDELDRARARIATGIALAGERPSGRMHRLGSQWAYGLPPIPIEKEMERIENLTLQDLRQCLIDFPMKPVVIGRMLPPAIKDH